MAFRARTDPHYDWQTVVTTAGSVMKGMTWFHERGPVTGPACGALQARGLLYHWLTEGQALRLTNHRDWDEGPTRTVFLTHVSFGPPGHPRFEVVLHGQDGCRYELSGGYRFILSRIRPTRKSSYPKAGGT